MDFTDIIDFIFNLLSLGNAKSEKKKPRVYTVFEILLFLEVFWFVWELGPIIHLRSPFLFIGLSVVSGAIFSVLTVIVIYRIGLIDRLTKRDFFLILITVTLLTVCLASLLNRTWEIMYYD